jgi:hypothetical protein
MVRLVPVKNEQALQFVSAPYVKLQQYKGEELAETIAISFWIFIAEFTDF